MPLRGTSYAACEGLRVEHDPMDPSTYGTLLALRGVSLEAAPASDEVLEHHALGRPLCGTYPLRLLQQLADLNKVDEAWYTVPEMHLRQDFAAMKVCWDAHLVRDFWRFTANTNPIMALWASHPVHPISREERVVITILHMLFVMMISSAVPRAEICVANGIGCSAGDGLLGPVERVWGRTLSDMADSTPPEAAQFCCLAQQIGLTWFIQHLSFGLALGGLAYTIVANIIFAQVLYQFGAMCACAQHMPRSSRHWCELLGHLLMLIIGVLMLVPLPNFISYNISHGLIALMLLTFVVGKLGSAVFTTAFQSILFCVLWRRQCPAGADGHAWGLDWAPTKDPDDLGDQSFNITAAQYRAYLRDLKG